MNEKVLVAMHGLPRSGKTTWARAFAAGHNAPIVCPDAIRLALHGQRFVADAEGFVWATAKVMVRALFLAGHDHVVLDATNGSRKRRDEWRDPRWRICFAVIDTPRDECIRRAQALDDVEIIPVIERMAAAWEPLGDDEEALLLRIT